MLRHLPVLLFVLGVPFFAMALADPQTGFTREEVSYPGRRIALLVDASTSMVMSFKSTRFKTQGESTFFTAVAGAEYFIKRRMNGPYRDLVALIQFGNQAYVVTPFTNDYENILLSVRLVGDPREWGRFSDWGTTIIEGIDQATQLFKAFNFVNASGNLMIVFTDGRDSELNRAEQAARRPGQRSAHAEDSGPHDPDRLQLPARRSAAGQDLEGRGGAHRRPLLRGLRRRVAVGRAGRDRPAVARAASTCASTACSARGSAPLRWRPTALWLLAAVLKLGFGMFRTFP